MSDPRINPAHIAALKSWLITNRDALLAQGIDRIDAHYTDDNLEADAFDDIRAYAVTNSGSTFTEVQFGATRELGDLLEVLVQGDNFFPGQEGGGGVFRLLVTSGAIEHASFEYVTTKLNHDVESY